MGYCYDQRGRLCCDYCGDSGARKYPCPFGYCPQTAACPNCHTKHKAEFSAAHHREHGCERAHAQFVARQQERARLLEAGEYCLRAAVGIDGGLVRVTFEGKNRERTVLMPKELYTWDTGNETLSSYEQKHGAPLPDAGEPVRKQVMFA